MAQRPHQDQPRHESPRTEEHHSQDQHTNAGPDDPVAHTEPGAMSTPPRSESDEREAGEAVRAAHATRAASTVDTTTPEPPTAILENPPPAKGLDPRLALAHDLARRGLSFASVNDVAKAVLLMLDVHTYQDHTTSVIGKAAAKGEAPTLL